jgi:hypothetical protein
MVEPLGFEARLVTVSCIVIEELQIHPVAVQHNAMPHGSI